MGREGAPSMEVENDRGRAPRRASAELVVGQIAGQGFLVIALPVLSRVFPPAELGAFQLAAAVAVVLGPLATLCLEYVIPVAPGRVVGRLRRRALLTTGAVAAAALLAAAGVAPTPAAADGEQLVMIGLLVLAYSGTIVDNAVLIRSGESRRLALRNLLAGFLGGVLQIVAALTTHLVVVTAAGVLVGRLIAVVATRSRIPAGDDGGSEGQEHTGVRALGWSATAKVTSLISMQTLTLLAAPLLGIAAAGVIGVAMRVAGGPISLAGQGLQQVSQSVLAPILRAGRPGAESELRHLVTRLAVPAVVVAVLLGALGPTLAPILLGDSWAQAGLVVAVLAVPFALQLLSTPLFPVLVMLGRQRLLAVLQIVRLVACTLGILGGWASGGGLVGSTIAYAVVESLGCAVVIGAALVTARAYDAAASG